MCQTFLLRRDGIAIVNAEVIATHRQRFSNCSTSSARAGITGMERAELLPRNYPHPLLSPNTGRDSSTCAGLLLSHSVIIRLPSTAIAMRALVAQCTTRCQCRRVRVTVLVVSHRADDRSCPTTPAGLADLRQVLTRHYALWPRGVNLTAMDTLTTVC